jgi:CBS domain-containing protein
MITQPSPAPTPSNVSSRIDSNPGESSYVPRRALSRGEPKHAFFAGKRSQLPERSAAPGSTARSPPKLLTRQRRGRHSDAPAMAPESSRRLPPAASSVPVTEAMTRPVVTVDPEMEIVDLMRLFVTAAIGGAPVVDASGTPIGVVSKTDLLRELYDRYGSGTGALIDAPPLEPSADDASGAIRARDIMTANPVVVTESTSLSHAARLMAREHLHRVFVVDARGAITGVLSSSDIVHWLSREDEDADR